MNTENKQNLVSIVMPAFNCKDCILDAIISVLRQTYQDFEIIIVNDGSIDNTKSVIDETMKKYPDKIRYFYQPNMGLSAARNRGIKEAGGEFIALLDSDDELAPNALEECISVLRNNKYDWCIADILRIEGDKKEIIASNIPDNDLLSSILKYYFIKIAPFYRKDSMLDIGLYDERLKVLEDWDLNIRMLEADKKFAYIHKPLYVYKIRKKSLVKNNTKNVLFFTLRILKKHHKRMALLGDKAAAKIYSEQMWRLSRRYLYELKDIKHSLSCLLESLRWDFSFKRLLHPVFFRLGWGLKE